jgi:hypothetical protein
MLQNKKKYDIDDRIEEKKRKKIDKKKKIIQIT